VKDGVGWTQGNKQISTWRFLEMDIPILASILTGSFLNFRGDPETLYRCLLSRNDFRSLAGVPSNARGFLSKLREISPELHSLGVTLTVLSSGLITIQARADAEKVQAEESRLRTAFFSNLPEGAETRRGFQRSEDGFQRFLSYTRGMAAGRIHEPRGGRVAEEHGKHAEQVDPRLPPSKTNVGRLGICRQPFVPSGAF
jgi:hypothetical protein